MKNQIYRGIAVLGIFFGLVVASVQAQAPARVEVNIPFEFSAGKTTLKAGVYTITRMSGNLVTLRNVENKSSVILNAPVNLSSTASDSTERLVFNKYGEEYFLAQIWLTADSGRELLKKNKTRQPERIELSFRVSKHVD
jgi:hypothetical protein